jgi:hypothetical protein
LATASRLNVSSNFRQVVVNGVLMGVIIHYLAQSSAVISRQPHTDSSASL